LKSNNTSILNWITSVSILHQEDGLYTVIGAAS
jgi:hypothetical protein